MKRRGVIYDYLWARNSGEVAVAITRAAKAAYHATKLLASALIVVGLAGLFMTLKPVVTSEISYNWGRATGEIQREQKQNEQMLVFASFAQEQEKEKTRQKAQELGLPDAKFGVYIPKINAKAPVIENVSASKEAEYMNALKQGVAHASGSVFPGMEGATFLFAHSSEVPWNIGSQYNTIFYLLRELEPGTTTPAPLGGGPALPQVTGGDEIYVFFLDKIYKYRVTEKHTVDPNDVSWLTDARVGKERLILQTCWPPGTALKRMIIVAEPVTD
ncbi:MAG: sortase [bacterium]|nr:sortase [bacterium]